MKVPQARAFFLPHSFFCTRARSAPAAPGSATCSSHRRLIVAGREVRSTESLYGGFLRGGPAESMLMTSPREVGRRIVCYYAGQRKISDRLWQESPRVWLVVLQAGAIPARAMEDRRTNEGRNPGRALRGSL